MKFLETPIRGAFLIDLDFAIDERGFFARTFCEEEFRKHGLETHIAQCNLSHSEKRGTIRGLHFQLAPHAETKLVRCVRGAIFDVVVDLETGAWFGAELTDSNRRMMFVPRTAAHGFQTLTDDAEVLYEISTKYEPSAGSGFRWDDPAIGIRWPLEASLISEKDRSWPFRGAHA